MKTQTTLPPADPTEALLQGLIAECHAVIREVLVPGLRAVDPDDHRSHIHSINDLMGSAVKLSDAIGHLRGTAPTTPEIRQRITVERVQTLAPVPQLSTSRGEGG